MELLNPAEVFGKALSGNSITCEIVASFKNDLFVASFVGHCIYTHLFQSCLITEFEKLLWYNYTVLFQIIYRDCTLVWV